MNICRVRGCRYSSTHTTRHHRCGNCGELGHGVVECGNQTRIEYLKQYFHETLPTHKHCSGHHDNVSDGLFHSDELVSSSEIRRKGSRATGEVHHDPNRARFSQTHFNQKR